MDKRVVLASKGQVAGQITRRGVVKTVEVAKLGGSFLGGFWAGLMMGEPEVIPAPEPKAKPRSRSTKR